MSTPDEHLPPPDSADERDALDALDRRAADAAADLHARAGARAVPAFAADRDAVVAPLRRPDRRVRVVAIAAAVIVIAAVAGLLATRSDGPGDDDKATVTTGEPRPFVTGAVPEGLQLNGVGDITGDGRATDDVMQMSGTGPVTLFGPADDDPRLGISAFLSRQAADFATSTAEQVDLPGGRRGYRWDDRGLGAHALLVPDGDQLIVVVASEDGDWFRAVAGAATLDPAGTVDLHGADLPDGWRTLGQAPELLTLGTPLLAMFDAAAVGRYAVYATPGTTVSGASTSGDGSDSTRADGAGDPPADDATLLVGSTSGGTVQLHAASLLADTTETTTVRGHRAVLTTSRGGGAEPFPTRSVAWLERPGELVRVSANGLSEDQLLAAAEGVEPVGTAEWTDLVERSQLGEFDPAASGGDLVVGDGRFPDGTRWRLTVNTGDDPDHPSPSVDLAIASADPEDADFSSSGTGTASGDGSAVLSTIELSSGGRRYTGVLVGDEVARLELRRGDEVLGEPSIVEGNGYRGAAVESPGDGAELVVLAADGRELGRIAVGQQDGTETTTPIEGPDAGSDPGDGGGSGSDSGSSSSGSSTGSGSSSSGSSSGSGSGG